MEKCESLATQKKSRQHDDDGRLFGFSSFISQANRTKLKDTTKIYYID